MAHGFSIAAGAIFLRCNRATPSDTTLEHGDTVIDKAAELGSDGRQFIFKRLLPCLCGC